MHRALGINEILREIFLRVLEDDVNAKSTAYHSALACKQFLPHALDTLWFSMKSLKPLLALIPKSVVKIDVEQLAMRNFATWVSFVTLPTKDDLALFDAYARRVRELHNLTYSGIDLPTMMTILDCLGRTCLLPNLRVLNFGAKLTTHQSDCFFLSRSLQKLRLAVSHDLVFFLPRLVQVAPFIRHLELPYHYDGIPKDSLHFLNHLRQLTFLHTTNRFIISPESFLTTFPFAQRLVGWRTGSISLRATDGNTLSYDSVQFSALTTLTFSLPMNSGDIFTLFSQPVFPSLHDLTICAPTYNDDLSEDQPADVAYAAAYKASFEKFFPSLFKNRHLQFLCINKNVYHGSRREEGQLDFSQVLVDVPMQTLSTLWILDGKLFEAFTPASVERFRNTFPFLSYLKISPPDDLESAMISFDELAVLADRLALLQRLEITINSQNLEDPPSVPILVHHLRVLGIEGSLIDDDFLFVRYVGRIFHAANLAEIENPTYYEAKLLEAFKFFRGCVADRDELIKNPPKRKPQTARRGRGGSRR